MCDMRLVNVNMHNSHVIQSRCMQSTSHINDNEYDDGINVHSKNVVLARKTSSSAMAEKPRELGDFKKARVNGGTNNHSLKDSHKCLRCR